ncbi:AAA family ATPase [Stenotrophomonas maltophilia]|uniref:AAA family ATPase n=1 Tax=Stenotrophomonas maltophilia TaxID=40324 RepID=UPI0012FE38C5|nr:AAA family ATPase [Stenotrophomonas maltophilia]
MDAALTKFEITGLHGKFDVSIPIRDNRLILVGVNGLGKTTVVNCLYFLLTSQWQRLLDIEFDEIAVEIDSEYVRLGRADIQQKIDSVDRHYDSLMRLSSKSVLPARMVRRLIDSRNFAQAQFSTGAALDRHVQSISKETDIPVPYVRKLITEFEGARDLFGGAAQDSQNMAEFLHRMQGFGDYQVLYLPTYRRIEQDIKSIFPALDESDLKKFHVRSDQVNSNSGRGYIELVQFGMQDVESKIREGLEEIRETARSQMTNLTATYLKDIISNRADEVRSEFFHGVDDGMVEYVLGRVEENTLSENDKVEVRISIAKMREGRSGYTARDKYLAYFFHRLLNIYVGLDRVEQNIRALMDTCNRYLVGKRMIYDDVSFSSSIVGGDGGALTWKMLSSGEKQIASLFSHLILSRNESQIVIIDEPELSLSVPWQKSLLPDVVATERCRLLVAVTHSPFIYSNKLDGYAIDLSRCITRYGKAG